MSEDLLPKVLATVRMRNRKADKYDPPKFKYMRSFRDLPSNFTHIIFVVKFGMITQHPEQENNFVLTAYLVNRKLR